MIKIEIDEIGLGLTILGLFVGVVFALLTTGLNPVHIFIEGLAGGLIGMAIGILKNAMD